MGKVRCRRPSRRGRRPTAARQGLGARRRVLEAVAPEGGPPFVERRSEPRFVPPPTMVSATWAKGWNTQVIIWGELVNVSRRGAAVQFSCGPYPPEGSYVFLQVMTPDRYRVMEARVVASDPSGLVRIQALDAASEDFFALVMFGGRAV